MSIGATGIVAVCTALSRLLGFVRVSLIGFLFGATGQADVLNAVFQIPNNLRRLLAEGALSSAFTPVLSDTLAHDLRATERTRAFVQTMIGFQLLICIPLLLLATLFSAPITAALFDFPLKEQMQDADRMFRLLIWYILPISINAICMATLNVHGHFTIPALAPLVSSIMVISITLALQRRLGVYAVSIGILLGGLIQVLIHTPALLYRRYRLLPTLQIRNPDLRRVARKWLLIMSSALLLFVNQQVAIYFASGLEVGSGSAMVYALTFWQLPFGILGISVITVLYPRMSTQYARGQHEDARRTYYDGARYLIHVFLPATIFLLCVSDDVIFLALQRGKFTLTDTMRTAAVLRAYSVGLLGVALFQHSQRFYYAIHKIPFTSFVLVGVVAIDIACSLWLKETRLRVSGLGLANSIAFWVGAIVLYARLPHSAAQGGARGTAARDMARGTAAQRNTAAHSAARRSGSRSYVPRLLLCVIISAIVPISYRYLFPLAAAPALSPFLRAILLLLCTFLYSALVLTLYRWFQIAPHPREFLLRKK